MLKARWPAGTRCPGHSLALWADPRTEEEQQARCLAIHTSRAILHAAELNENKKKGLV